MNKQFVKHFFRPTSSQPFNWRIFFHGIILLSVTCSSPRNFSLKSMFFRRLFSDRAFCPASGLLWSNLGEQNTNILCRGTKPVLSQIHSHLACGCPNDEHFNDPSTLCFFETVQHPKLLSTAESHKMLLCADLTDHAVERRSLHGIIALMDANNFSSSRMFSLIECL